MNQIINVDEAFLDGEMPALSTPQKESLSQQFDFIAVQEFDPHFRENWETQSLRWGSQQTISCANYDQWDQNIENYQAINCLTFDDTDSNTKSTMAIWFDSTTWAYRGSDEGNAQHIYVGYDVDNGVQYDRYATKAFFQRKGEAEGVGVYIVNVHGVRETPLGAAGKTLQEKDYIYYLNGTESPLQLVPVTACVFHYPSQESGDTGWDGERVHVASDHYPVYATFFLDTAVAEP